jgi:diguanylate cyclase (GGDEF)-like protein
MKVDEMKLVEWSSPVDRKTWPTSDSARETLTRDRETDGEDTQIPEGDTIDIESLRGLTPEDLTPNVRIAMMQLVEEITLLRHELSRNRKRIAYLSDMVDHDELSTVLNRRTFLRELGHAQLLAREYGALNTLLFLTVRNLKDINEIHGHATGNAVVEHVSETLMNHTGKADVVGRLGGAKFAVVLVGSNVEKSGEKAVWVKKLLSNCPFVDGDMRIQLEVDVVLHALEVDEEADGGLTGDNRDHPAV